MTKFYILWTSQVASIFGSSIVNFALVWYLTKQTGSATILATVMLVNFIPIIAFSPFIGALVDRWNRKRIMIYSDFVIMVLTVALVILFYIGANQLWHIYLIIACRAIGQSFQSPALSASVSMIVPEKHLVRANAMSRTTIGVFNIIGPPCGAFLIETLPMQWVLSVDIITAIITISFLLAVTIPQPIKTTLIEKQHVIRDMIQGFKYVASWKGLFYLIVLGTLLNFFAAHLNAILPLFVTHYLGGTAINLGWLQTAFGIGIVAGGILLSIWGGFNKRIVTISLGFLIWCIAITLFGFTTESLFFLSLSTLFATGFGNSLVNSPIGAILQAYVDRDMQGRVLSIVGSVSVIMLPIGLAIVGPLVDAVGIRPIYICSGIMMLVFALMCLLNKKDVKNIETNSEITKLDSKANLY